MINKDKLWDWPGWQVVKWFFGAFILWLVLYTIYKLETVDNYEEQLMNRIGSVHMEIPKFTLPDKWFDDERMIK